MNETKSKNFKWKFSDEKKKKLNQKREILSEICGCVGLAPTTSNFIFKQKQKKLVKKDDPNIFIN